MLVYILLLFVLVLGMYFVDKFWTNRASFPNDEKEVSMTGWLFIIVLAFAYSLVLGVRHEVGTDFASYYEMFQVGYTKTEYLYTQINLFVKKIGGSFPILMSVMALLTITPVFYVIIKYSPYPAVSMVILFGVGFVFAMVNHVRQTAAVSIFLLSVPLVWKRRPLGFFSLIGVAAGFHYTALIMAPFYWVAKARTPIWFLLLVFIVSFVLFLNPGSVREYLHEPLRILSPHVYQHYVDMVFRDSPGIDTRLGVFLYGLIFILVLLVFPKASISGCLKTRVLFLLSFYGAAGTMFFATFWQLNRIPAYLVLVWVIFFPVMISLLKSKQEKNLAVVIVCIVFLVLYGRRILANAHDALPYQTIF